MLRECKDCGERMMIIQEGFPQYTYGSYVLYGCPNCGKVEFEFDGNNDPDNRIQTIYDPYQISQTMISS